MTKPIINFVWIGPPKYNLGGQDVLGPESFSENFKTYYPDHAVDAPNQMVFWCLSKYQETYKDYFAEHNIAIQVESIQDFLFDYIHICYQACEKLKKLSKPEDPQLLKELELAEGVVKYLNAWIFQNPTAVVRHYIRAKDLFVNALLAIKGNYVLDTNIFCAKDVKVSLAAYDQFMYPIIKAATPGDYTPDVHEIWIQYSPPNSLARAKLSLDQYLSRCQIAIPTNRERNQEIFGRLAVDIALRLQKAKFDRAAITHGVWDAEENKTSSYLINIPSLGICKEYYNSYVAGATSSFYAHALTGEHDRLVFDLNHGISPSYIEPFYRKYTNFSLLLTAIHFFLLRPEKAHYSRCIELLLSRGADPDAIGFCDGKGMSAVERCIKNKNDAILDLLFDARYKTPNVHLIVNGKSLLELAEELHYEHGKEVLLEHGATAVEITEPSILPAQSLKFFPAAASDDDAVPNKRPRIS